MAHTIETHLKPLQDLQESEGIEGLGRGIAFQIVENMGVVDRRDIANDVRSLEQDHRGQLRRKGVRFGAYHVFVPALIKPAPAALAGLLWAVFHDKLDEDGRDQIVQALGAGRTSVVVDQSFNQDLYRLSGFRVLGNRAVRVDILERLADLIRPAIAWRRDGDKTKARPDGAWDGVGFFVTPPMLSILGARHEDMADILKGLGYHNDSMEADKVSEKLASWDGTAFNRDVPKSPDEKRAGSVPENNAHADTAPAAETLSPSQKEDTASPAEEAISSDKLSTQEPEEPKRIDIWRPGSARRDRDNDRSGNRRGGRGDQAGSRDAGKGKSGARHGQTGKGKQSDRGRNGKRNASGKPAEKPMDPNSPFAKLAALKKNLETGDG